MLNQAGKSRIYQIMIDHSTNAVEETVELLTGAPEVIMPTCALAQLSLPVQKWVEIKKKKIKGKLLKVWRPKELSQSS